MRFGSRTRIVAGLAGLALLCAFAAGCAKDTSAQDALAMRVEAAANKAEAAANKAEAAARSAAEAAQRAEAAAQKAEAIFQKQMRK